MLGRIIEIAEDRRYLSVSRGFLVVKESGGDGEKVGQVPLDDIAALIANAHGLIYSNNVLVALGGRGAPVVVCGKNHNVVSMLWPVDGNYQQSKRIDAQISATRPASKRLWADIVRYKLRQQTAALEAVGAPTAPLLALVGRVRSGDPTNVEAQGARRYWSLLFGKDFRRNRQAGGINGLLNYGYTVLRAATARAVVAAGLHPAIALHHSNEGNPMRLVDDLMEPFRPIVDLRVRQLDDQGVTEVDASSKRVLALALYQDLRTDSGVTPVTICLQRLATSLAQVFLGERRKLDFPQVGVPVKTEDPSHAC